MTAKRRAAILISGRGSNMTALIEAARATNYPAEISLVMSNKPDAGGLLRAREAGIATEAIESKTFGKDREAFERALHAVLERHTIELVCLAGFMRLLTPWFVQQWHGRMINIHPALLPAYPGLHTHERALADGATDAWRDSALCRAGNGRRTNYCARLGRGEKRRYARYAGRARPGR